MAAKRRFVLTLNAQETESLDSYSQKMLMSGIRAVSAGMPAPVSGEGVSLPSVGAAGNATDAATAATTCCRKDSSRTS